MDVRLNVLGSWKADWVTTNVDSIFGLVYANIVNAHGSRECQPFEINKAKIWRESQVGDDVLMFKRRISLAKYQI